MNKEKILQKLCNDEEYYGDFGNQYLSNSHVGKLLKDPLNAFKPSKPSPAFLIGGYFHTCILEPDKLEKFKIFKSSTTNTHGKAASVIKRVTKPAITKVQMAKAVEYVTAGGKVEAIESKYKLTNEQRKNLTKTL